MPWKDIDISEKLFTNVTDAATLSGAAALENAFMNEQKGISRFPGLANVVTLIGNLPTYLHEWDKDLIAVTNGHVYRINQAGIATDVTGVPVSGDGRVVFDRSPNELLMAAGGPIIRLGAATTETLSENAPLSTHVGYSEGRVLASERGTGNFLHSAANSFRNWDPIDIFSADVKPDPINALFVTPYREVMVLGIDSMEQFDPIASADTPYVRRWGVAEGLSEPYANAFVDNAVWMLNRNREVVRASGQVSQSFGDDIGMTLEGLDDWSMAWMTGMSVKGQKLMLLQAPNATTVYGTKGVTVVFDYRQKKWLNLYGWDSDLGVPSRWPGWSYYRLWDRHFVGGNGRVYELDSDTYANAGVTQRVLWRSAHIDMGEIRVDDVQLRLKRGSSGSNATEPVISLRSIKDNKVKTRWNRKGLGLAGDRSMYVNFGSMGCADSWQFEIDMTDAADYEITRLQILPTPIGQH